MRQEGTPLDLNNLPEDYGGDRHREGKQVSEESSTTAIAEAPDARCRKKKNGKEGKECGKIYECRFCSLKFCKSQALGGHMNRHRQERETETLNRARQLVFSNENLGGQGPFLGCNIPSMPAGNYSQRGPMGDPSLSFRPVYARLPSPSSPSILPQQTLQPYLYPSSSRLLSFPSPYAPPPTNDYFVGHVLSPHRPMNPNYSNDSNYTCIGAPIVTHSFPSEGLQAPTVADSLRFNQANGLNWNCEDGDRPHVDGSPMNRFRNDY